MAYRSHSFPPSTLLYPTAKTVLEYLDSYAAHFDIKQHIRLRTEVQSMNWDSNTSKWQVKTRAVNSDNQEVVETADFDLVIVANGHYRVPYYPPTPGLEAWKEGGKVMHAAWYRHAEHKGDTVLVVGRGPSGMDVADEMREVSCTIVHSYPGAEHADNDGGTLKTRGRITEFLDPKDGIVRFEDGTTEKGIDFCILATGYEHSLPFIPARLLRSSLPPPIPPIPSNLYNSKFNIFPLAKQIFPLVTSVPPSSLAFIGLPYRVVPFPLSESQTRAVLAVLENPERLNPAQEAVDIVSRYEELRAQVGDNELAIARLWHKLEDDEQFNYQDDLHQFIGGESGREKWKMPGWIRDSYRHKFTLRAEWKDLVKRGEAEEWVRGVGEGGEEDWVYLMRRLVERAEKRQAEVSVETAKMNRL